MNNKSSNELEFNHENYESLQHKYDKEYSKNHNARKKNNSRRNFWIMYTTICVVTVILVVLAWHDKAFTWQQ